MKYWRINTDSTARDDVKTCDIWYKQGMAFAGDFAKTKRRHDKIFEKFSPGDGVFMHHSLLGVVGYGIVSEEWDGETYKGEKGKLYKKEDFEYRIAVDWGGEFDAETTRSPSTKCCHILEHIQRWSLRSGTSSRSSRNCGAAPGNGLPTSGNSGLC